MADPPRTTRVERAGRPSADDDARTDVTAGVDRSLYTREGGRIVPTELARGPWSDDAQHGGPVAALLAGAAEAHQPVDGMAMVRVTVELLRPVPLRPHRLRVAIAQRGRSLQRVSVSLSDAASGDLLATALCLRMRRRPTDVPAQDAEPAPPLPESAAPASSLPGFAQGADRLSLVTHGLEMRFVDGAFDRPGPATAWFRLRHPVIDGEPILPMQRVLVAADCANGISGVDDFSRLLYVNADLHVAVSRLPAGEWVCMASRSHIDAGGTGVSSSRLWDADGPIGTAAQTLLVARRGI